MRELLPGAWLVVFYLSKQLQPLLLPLGAVWVLLGLTLVAIRRRRGIASATCLSGLLILSLLGNRWISLILASHLERRYSIGSGSPPRADAIVVLAAEVESTGLPGMGLYVNNATANRLFYGAKLYRQGLAPVVILSGGRPPGCEAFPPESKLMAELIQTMGVPSSATIEETRSRDTYENAIGVQQILSLHRLYSILLVTSAIHMPRSMAIFQHLGVQAFPAPADFRANSERWAESGGNWENVLANCFPAADNLELSTVVLHEYLGLAAYKFLGRL